MVFQFISKKYHKQNTLKYAYFTFAKYRKTKLSFMSQKDFFAANSKNETLRVPWIARWNVNPNLTMAGEHKP